MLHNIQSPTIINALENNMIGKFRYLPDRVDSMSVNDKTGLLIIDSQLPSDMFNIICHRHPVGIVDIKSAIQHFTNKKLPFAWWAGFQSEPKDFTQQLKANGLIHTEHELGMAVKIDDLPTKPLPTGLSIQPVTNDKTLDDFISIIVALVPKEAKPIREFFTQGANYIFHADSQLHCYVGYVDGKPIATSALFCDDCVAGVWDVITLPAARGKGIGTAMTLAALREAEKLGYNVGVLTASDEGQFVYRKLGFQEVCQLGVYNLSA